MLTDRPALPRNLRRQNFLKSGLELVDEALCPLCETAWDLEELRSLIQKNMAEASEAATLKQAVDGAAAPLKLAIEELSRLLSEISTLGDQLVLPTTSTVLEGWFSTLQDLLVKLSDLEDVAATITLLEADWIRTPTGVNELLHKIKTTVDALPDPSKEEAARDYLIAGQERLEIYRTAKRALAAESKKSALVTKVFDTYNASSSAFLTKIYKGVEKDFSRFYRFINRDDEASFEGKLTPSLGKLGFDVDFYGRGFFPPGAYHSEGHQDAMGLCLYLALMKHTLGENFTFAVLDDVLMSVDAGHRREVCGLLKLEFSRTQFIFTTHDPIWLAHMKTEAVITSKSAVQFRKWTVDDGPMVWDDKEVWEEIAKDLEKDNIPAAAGTLRRFLEYIASQLSHRLRATIEFHGDAQYDLGELMPAVVKAWKNLLGRALETAQSWGKAKKVDIIKVRREAFSQIVATSQVEQWAINKSIHYNEWATFRKEDFIPVVEAFKDLIGALRCDNCNSFFYVTPPKGSRESVRCDCTSVDLNLKKRPAA